MKIRPAFVVALLLAATSCGAADLAAIADGEEAAILQPDGSTIEGIAIAIRKRAGTRAPAIFRGPRALARRASDGDFEFDEDSLPNRVRLLGPGEEMRRTR